MLDQQNRFIMEDFAHKEPFCSFLPGVAGETGVPMWCYYVNRGQAITSFGVENKDHAIMEFFPAHQAYQYTQRVGFRTFIRLGDTLIEPFSDVKKRPEMRIGMNDLTILEKDAQNHITTEVNYFTLPYEPAAALMRRVTLRNDSDKPATLELLDGMPALLPYGVNLFAAKEMTQTAKAWMQAEDTQSDMPCFRVRASMEDTSDVQQVKGVNFAMGITQDNKPLRAFVDPRHVFGCDTSLGCPLGFMAKPMEAFVKEPENTVNILPCCFFGLRVTLAPGQSHTHALLFGQAKDKTLAKRVCDRMRDFKAWSGKHDQALTLTQELTNGVRTQTGDPIFDLYCRQTCLDNLLRGGSPSVMQSGRVLYRYSRKHGDPERDYNAFRMLPEYDSQGNGNFRDVNQNRRMDVLFEPRVDRYNIRLFYDLIQADGYNPLVIECVRFTLTKQEQETMIAQLPAVHQAKAKALLARPFTPGELHMALQEWLGEGETAAKLYQHTLDLAKQSVSASFGEGYWSDHWTYNLDQVHSYLSLYPDREELLFYGQPDYTWYVSPVSVKPRAQRYVQTDKGVRQYQFLTKREGNGATLLAQSGKPITATLIEKLLVLLGVKTSTLDAYGMGVEMEGGKPGWYDALNGLPGLLGSSVAETLELCRELECLLQVTKRYQKDVQVFREAACFLDAITDILTAQQSVWSQQQEILPVWNALCDAREAYRTVLEHGVSGEKTQISAAKLVQMLTIWHAFVKRGVEKALALGNGLIPTYFAYEVTQYTKDAQGLHPTELRPIQLPVFLEGQVRLMRLLPDISQKQALYHKIKQSALYDRPLGMYKVNAALCEASYEIGRAHAFTPGWLENESVWLHMEYKYLLELLRAKMYDAFFADFKRAAVPFQDPAVYGRSTLENSSFIASSVNPDPAIRGKGFVARLSGSTAEMIQLWCIMLLGERLFTVQNDALTLTLAPALPDYLTHGTDTIVATLLGKTEVVYHIEPDQSYIPNQYEIANAQITWRDGRQESYTHGLIVGDAASHVRDGQAERIELWLKRQPSL